MPIKKQGQTSTIRLDPCKDKKEQLYELFYKVEDIVLVLIMRMKKNKKMMLMGLLLH